MGAIKRAIDRIGWSATVLIVIGLVFAAMGTVDLYRILAARDWPRVPGHIVASDIHRTRSPDGETFYHLSVTYRYRYLDREYDGTRIAFGDSFDTSTGDDPAHAAGNRALGLFGWEAAAAYGDADRGMIEERARAFPVDGAVTVHVDPERPDRAVIDVEPSWYNTRHLLRAAILLIVAAIAALFGHLRRHVSGHKAPRTLSP